MTRRATILLIALIALHGDPVAALEVGDKVGPVWINPGSVICDTTEQVHQAVDPSTPFPVGCGRLMEQSPAYIEALSEHKFRGETYILLKLMFLPVMHHSIQLGVQFGWEDYKKESPIIKGMKI